MRLKKVKNKKFMKRIYIVKDVLAASICITFLADNDDLAKRHLEGFIVSPHPNLVNTFVQDKQVYFVASIDEKTMLVKAQPEPQFICDVKEIQDKVISDLCHNEDFVKAQLAALKKQKEVINGKPIKRKEAAKA